MKRAFFGGVHPKGYKELSREAAIVPLHPSVVSVAMSQHIGAPCQPLVKVGDRVTVGQKIGDGQGLCVPVHASVSGTVTAIEARPHPGGNLQTAIVIESDGRDTLCPTVKPRDPEAVAAMSAEDLIAVIREAGITGMGGAGFPTSVKLSSGLGKVDTVIVNGAECEPYITSDDRLMRETPERVVGGLRVGQNENLSVRPARDADHLRVIRFADDHHRVAVPAVLLHKLVDMRHMGARRIDHGNAARLACAIHVRRHAMAADDDRFARRNFIQRFHAANARPAQALNLLRIVDQRPKRHAGELLFGTLESLEHRAPHAEAKSGMLSDCEFHTHLLPLSEGLLTHYSILPIFIHSRSFSFFLPKRGEFSNFFENIFPRAGLFRMKSAYAGVFSAGGSDFPPLSRAKAASMRSVSASQVSLFMRPARRSAISIGLPTCTTMRRNGL